MSSAANPSYDAIKARYESAGQAHLLSFYPSLSPSERSSLLSQLESLDVERVNRIYTRAIEAEQGHTLAPQPELKETTIADPEILAQTDKSPVAADAIEPLPAHCSASVLSSPEKTASWKKRGLEAIAQSQVAVLLMAGGQGTRLGSSAPKGCFDIGLPSGKTLFQIQAERIRRLQQVADQEAGTQGAKITWFVMTSGPTRKDTEAFFKQKHFFGLDEQDVIFFEQGMKVCCDS